jgi:ribosomal protein L16/L10AE
MNANNIQSLKQQVMNFQRNFKGNPKDIIMQKLNSGQITQEQLNEAQSRATQIMQLFK